jgi:hypothetical protein
MLWFLLLLALMVLVLHAAAAPGSPSPTPSPPTAIDAMDAGSRSLTALGQYLTGAVELYTGMGNYLTGAGNYVDKAADAAAKDADTWIKLNQYLYQCQLEQERRYARIQAARKKRLDDYEKHKIDNGRRLLDTPRAIEIERGGALNAILDAYTQPETFARAMATLRSPFSAERLALVPFSFARQGPIKTCLPDLSETRQWPAILSGLPFQAGRKAFEDQVYLLETLNRTNPPRPEALAALLGQIRGLAATLDGLRVDPRAGDGVTFNAAALFLAGLAGLVRTIETGFKPAEILANAFRVYTLDAAPTVADLLDFMVDRRLLFGPAGPPAEVHLYRDLHAYLFGNQASVLGPRGTWASSRRRGEDHGNGSREGT